MTVPDAFLPLLSPISSIGLFWWNRTNSGTDEKIWTDFDHRQGSRQSSAHETAVSIKTVADFNIGTRSQRTTCWNCVVKTRATAVVQVEANLQEQLVIIAFSLLTHFCASSLFPIYIYMSNCLPCQSHRVRLSQWCHSMTNMKSSCAFLNWLYLKGKYKNIQKSFDVFLR